MTFNYINSVWGVTVCRDANNCCSVNKKRRLVTERYNKNLSGVAGLQLNARQEGVKPNYAYYPVVFDGFRLTRDEVFDRLKAEGIVPRKYFYPLTSAFAVFIIESPPKTSIQ